MLNINDSKFDCFDNFYTLHELIGIIKKNQVVPFVGAGMSVGIYELWGKSLEKLMKGYMNGEDANKILWLINKNQYEKAASAIKEYLGPTTYLNKLISIFGEYRISNYCLKELSVRYLPMIFKDVFVITTNFDKILEKVFLLEDNPFEEKVVLRHLTDWQAERLTKGSLHYLIKIHGCVSAPDELIITEENYDELYKQRVSIHIDRLRRILFSRHLLFLGCGLNNDRTMDLLREVGLGGNYAILEMNGELNASDFIERRKFVADELGLNCIWYPKGEHHYVADILEYISIEANKI